MVSLRCAFASELAVGWSCNEVPSFANPVTPNPPPFLTVQPFLIIFLPARAGTTILRCIPITRRFWSALSLAFLCFLFSIYHISFHAHHIARAPRFSSAGPMTCGGFVSDQEKKKRKRTRKAFYIGPGQDVNGASCCAISRDPEPPPTVASCTVFLAPY